MNESKENIIKASLSLFIHNSYASVSMKDILDKAGLSRGAFYHYFESKEACFEECVKYYLTQVTHPESIDTELSLKAFLKENIKRMSHLTDMVSFHDRLLFFNEAIKIIPDFIAYMEQRNAKELADWTKIIEKAAKKGEITNRISAGEIAALFIAQCDGILVTRGMVSGKNAYDGYAEVEKQWNNLYSLIKK
ncbi:MAG: TetR/AcrR family transcriptional regulator [Leptospirales bacterium]|nr:TetR/AcrR family transcriptional regulator [Leptospirales bacterium]